MRLEAEARIDLAGGEKLRLWRLIVGLREWLEVWVRTASHRFGERPSPELANDTAGVPRSFPTRRARPNGYQTAW